MPTPSRILDRLDHVLEALSAGDLDAVESDMAFVRRKAPDAPERFLVEGILLRDGEGADDARAMEWFGKAAEAAPDWAAPLFEAGLTRLEHAPDEALRYAEKALALLEDDDPDRDVPLLLAATALAQLDRTDEALARAEALLTLGTDDPELFLDLAGLFSSLDDLEGACAALEAAVELDPEHADAWYALGSVRQELGEDPSDAWIRARELDLSDERPPWRLDAADLEALAERTLKELPEEVRTLLANVPILIADAPTEAQVKSGIDPRLLGLFEGTPLPHKGAFDQASAPDTATLFLRNLEASCADRDELEEQLRITLLHETAHYFGLEDEDLEKIGLG